MFSVVSVAAKTYSRGETRTPNLPVNSRARCRLRHSGHVHEMRRDSPSHMHTARTCFGNRFAGTSPLPHTLGWCSWLSRVLHTHEVPSSILGLSTLLVCLHFAPTTRNVLIGSSRIISATTACSSVGRAGDCSTCMISLGHWFDSGRADFFSMLGASIKGGRAGQKNASTGN